MSPLRSIAQWFHASTSASLTLEQGLQARADNFLILRIVAAALVIYGHTPHLAPAVHGPDLFVRSGLGVYSGDIAVDVFFLISGFLVTGSFARRRSFFSFAKARLLRIYPGFLANIVLLALVAGPLLSQLSLVDYLHDRETRTYILRNVRLSADMAWTLPGVFAAAKSSVVNGSQWTLPAELRMYLLLGLAGVFGMLSHRRISTLALGALMAIYFAKPELIPLRPDWLRLAGYFALGAVAFLWRDVIRVRLESTLALILLAAVLRHSVVYPQALALAIAATVFTLAYLTPPWRRLEKLGDPSYGLYLWGWPCQQWIAQTFPGAHWATHASLAITLALGLGYLSWHAVEKPSMRWKAAPRREAVVDPPA